MNPDSLCAQLLSAKYYSDGNILKAKPKSGMSYTWRSILSGIDLLKKGIVWRVGDGSSINIWEASWLPRDDLRRPYTPRGSTLVSRVSDLLDPNTGSWDVTMVRDLFWEEDAKLILCLPIHEGMDDILAWHYNKNGLPLLS